MLAVTYAGVYASARVAQLSPNGDGVDETQTFKYRVARPSTVSVSLVDPLGTTHPIETAQVRARRDLHRRLDRTEAGLDRRHAGHVALGRDREGRPGPRLDRRPALRPQHHARRAARHACDRSVTPAGGSLTVGFMLAALAPWGRDPVEGGRTPAHLLGAVGPARPGVRPLGRSLQGRRQRLLRRLYREGDRDERPRRHRPYGAVRRHPPVASARPCPSLASPRTSEPDRRLRPLRIFVLMFVDAILPAACEAVMVFGGAVAAGAFRRGARRLFGRSPTAWSWVASGSPGRSATCSASLGWGIGYYGGRPLVERHGRWVHLTQRSSTGRSLVRALGRLASSSAASRRCCARSSRSRPGSRDAAGPLHDPDDPGLGDLVLRPGRRSAGRSGQLGALPPRVPLRRDALVVLAGPRRRHPRGCGGAPLDWLAVPPIPLVDVKAQYAPLTRAAAGLRRGARGPASSSSVRT